MLVLNSTLSHGDMEITLWPSLISALPQPGVLDVKQNVQKIKSFYSCDWALSKNSTQTFTIWIQFLKRPGTCFWFESWIHSACDGSLITSRSHCILESLPTGVRWETKRLVSSIILEKSNFSFEAERFLRLGHELRGSLDPLNILFLLLI